MNKLKLYFTFILLMLFSISVFTQDQANLDKIRQRAAETHSDAVLVMRNGKTLVEYYKGDKNEKIELMSATKSIVSLAIGRLIEQGKIKSVDQPVHEFYPEWKQGKKASITIKHLLNHTSGLQNLPNTSYEIYPSNDFVKLALAAELSDEPGTKFSYNNKAVNLLAGIVQVASGKRLDVFMNEEFFVPMQIKDFNWTLDKAGNPHGMSGLQISAADFIKFGQLMLDRGKWNGKQIVSEKWIDESFAQSQTFTASSGLLWWRMSSDERSTIDDEQLAKLEKAGFEKSFLDKLATLKDTKFRVAEDPNVMNKIFEPLFGSDWLTIVRTQMTGKNTPLFKKIPGNMDTFTAQGYLGQYLVVIPKTNTVAVRQIKSSKQYNEKTDGFSDFMYLLMDLTN